MITRVGIIIIGIIHSIFNFGLLMTSVFLAVSYFFFFQSASPSLFLLSLLFLFCSFVFLFVSPFVLFFVCMSF